MSIRPTYRKRSVVQVLADGMSAHPPKPETRINVTADADSTPADFSEKLRKLSEEFRNNAQMRALRDAEGNIVEHLLTPRKFAAGGYVPSPDGGGKSCCKEAELTANELARRNEELSEAEEKIAALTEKANREGASVTINGTNKNGEELTMKFWSLDRDQALKSAVDSLQNVTKRAEKAEAERDELQAKLDAAEKPERPEPGWPEWLGPKINLDDLKPERAGDTAFRVDKQAMTSVDSADEAREAAENYVRLAASFAAIARFIENEQAATDDENQRVEEVAERATEALVKTILDFFNVEDSSGAARATARAIVREARDAGWTPPENEDGNE